VGRGVAVDVGVDRVLDLDAGHVVFGAAVAHDHVARLADVDARVRGGDAPDGLDLKALKLAVYGIGGRFPDVLFDGYVNKAREEGPQICLHDVSGVLNADGPGGYKNPVNDAKPYDCTLPKLPAVDLKRG
jgi:hypothetical protein